MSDLDSDIIEVEVLQVIPDGSVCVAIARDTTTGELLRFGGDWRPMAEIAAAIDMDETVITSIEPWQLLSS
jgi:hypothetical protein